MRQKTEILFIICLVTSFTLGVISPAFTAETLSKTEGATTMENAQTKTGGNEKQLEDQKENYDAHRSYVKLHFDDQEMDFSLQWVLGSIATGGCELGEGFYAAGSIKDGDPKSWQEQWEKMADRVLARAEESQAKGHEVSARRSFLRASNYYRNALVSMLPTLPKFKELADKSRAAFKKGAKLFVPPIEYFEIPFEGTVMPGYFIKANKSGKKTKTLIMIGGGETFIEDNYFYIAPQAIERGYNFLTVDLPGQGTMPLFKQFFRADTEVPIKAVLDYAYSRSEIDRDKLAMFGISNGGYFVPRAAQFDKRIKAVVVSAAVVDNYKMFKEMPFAKESQEEIDNWPPYKKCVTSAVAWRWGLDPSDVKGQVEATKDFQIDPSKITCPFLDLIGEGEYANEETQRQQKECLDALPNPNKKMIVTPLNEGASSHCIGDNRSLMSQFVFDWLDELFDGTRKK